MKWRSHCGVRLPPSGLVFTKCYPGESVASFLHFAPQAHHKPKPCKLSLPYNNTRDGTQSFGMSDCRRPHMRVHWCICVHLGKLTFPPMAAYSLLPLRRHPSAVHLVLLPILARYIARERALLEQGPTTTTTVCTLGCLSGRAQTVSLQIRELAQIICLFSHVTMTTRPPLKRRYTASDTEWHWERGHRSLKNPNIKTPI